MYFIPFSYVCTEIGNKETRSLHVFPNDQVPIGQYAYIEMYCIDPKCDCQLVRFVVLSENGQQHAMITYGWNDKAFYDKEFKFCNHNFPGPDFAYRVPQGPHAEYFLKFCKEVLVQDKEYVERLKRHYALFKKEAKERDLNLLMQSAASNKAGDQRRNDPCLCGSGKKYKNCCRS